MYPESSDRFKRAAMSDFRKRCDEAAAQMVLVLQSAYSSSEVKRIIIILNPECTNRKMSPNSEWLPM